jgi:formate dehydrogenase subunit beta
MCTQPVPANVAVRIDLFGADLAAGLSLEIEDELAARLGLQSAAAGSTERRKALLEQLLAARQTTRTQELAAIRSRMSSNGGLAGLFDACIRCHNCMTACPICYCKTCLFRTASFDHPAEHYFTAARSKGALRMLGDTLLFHLTRMNHMSASCVSCGMCTSACPADIPVGAIFSAVGESVQAAFEYSPGKDLEQPLPLITFQPNEWTEVGEAR